jgi:YqjK-like protein
MNRNLSAVLQRRRELLTEIAAQRLQVAALGAQWQVPLALADRGLAVIRLLRSHPALLACAAVLFVVRRRGVSGLLSAGWRVWKGYRFIITLRNKLSPRSQGS